MINLGETQHQKPQWIQSRCAIHQPGRDLCLPLLEEQHRRGCSSSVVLSQPRAPQNLGPEIKRGDIMLLKSVLWSWTFTISTQRTFSEQILEGAWNDSNLRRGWKPKELLHLGAGSLPITLEGKQVLASATSRSKSAIVISLTFWQDSSNHPRFCSKLNKVYSAYTLKAVLNDACQSHKPK